MSLMPDFVLPACLGRLPEFYGVGNDSIGEHFMAEPTQARSAGPRMIMATLLLDRPADVDYRLLAQRVGELLELNLRLAEEHKPGFPMILVADGAMITGMRIDAPYPAPLSSVAQFAYWWPNAATEAARSTSHVLVVCNWPKYSRLNAHVRHLILVRELVEQLPVIGVLWGSALVQADRFKGEFAHMQQNNVVPFSLWVLIQFSKQPNGNTLISTLGMRDFEQMEIETESALPFGQTFDLVRKFGSYILVNGPVVKDGETMGLTAEQRIKVRHVRSFRPDVNENVYWLELAENPTVERPKGFFSGLFGAGGKQ
jgi:Domain of unknown function (DUF4261)